MKPSTIVDQIRHEIKVLQGEETKELVYSSQQAFSNSKTAQDAFSRSVAKLLNVNNWSSLSDFTADFRLHDPTGAPKAEGPPKAGDYIQISLPGPTPTNWVRVIHVGIKENLAEFTVQPSYDPHKEEPNQVDHFFHQDTRSTFRVTLKGTMLTAYEIGLHEGVNNQGPQAGDRAFINTVIAEGGWLFYQKIQWKLLTDYLVHL